MREPLPMTTKYSYEVTNAVLWWMKLILFYQNSTCWATNCLRLDFCLMLIISIYNISQQRRSLPLFILCYSAQVFFSKIFYAQIVRWAFQDTDCVVHLILGEAGWTPDQWGHSRFRGLSDQKRLTFFMRQLLKASSELSLFFLSFCFMAPLYKLVCYHCANFHKSHLMVSVL